ncbi:MAG: hypothetical protein Q4A47_03780 [Erysipelotrichaceae bacterium]|nr:hypothetical protein [Erysipelotrichaceae bacterium]
MCKRKHRKNIYVSFLVMTIFLMCMLWFYMVSNVQKARSIDQWMYGITIDDTWYERVSVHEIVDAIKNMPVKPTVRVVMSLDRSPSTYETLFKELNQVAYVMASPVDSSDMSSYKDEESYLKRFKETYDVLSMYVDVWEIGNEINGIEWIQQDSKLIVNKVSQVSAFIKDKGAKSAVTLYYTDPSKEDMFDWMSKYFSDSWTLEIDYILISYYEDDNDGYKPDWNIVFSSLEAYFPSSKLGIGECGNTAIDASDDSKISRIRSYYSAQKYSESFVGGYFWWYWVEDCIPHTYNKLYEEINYGMQLQEIMLDEENKKR